MKKHEYKNDNENVEYKEFTFEIKEIDDQGNFKGMLSPYNNVDLGNDRVMPSIGKRNDGKRVPFLWQHKTDIILGELLLKNTRDGMAVEEGKVILDKSGDNFMIPKAAEAFALMKRGLLKMSIGYVTIKKEFDKQGVRNLIDIDIKEGSAVTFPMNPKAKITDVKEEGVKVKVTPFQEHMEKAASFGDVLQADDMRRKRYQNMRAIDMSIDSTLRDEEMTADQKKSAINSNIDDFSTSMKATMGIIIDAKKFDTNEMESKEFMDELETKAKKGTGLAKVLNAAIDKMVTDKRSKGDIIKTLASRANVSESTMNQILGGSIIKPPKNRLSAIASVLGLSVDSLVSTADSDAEKAFDEQFEQKKGAVISKSNMAKIASAMEALKALMDMSSTEAPKAEVEDEVEFKLEDFSLDLEVSSIGKEEEK